MDEKEKEKEKESLRSEKLTEVMPGLGKFVDPRPTDLQVFFMLLPQILGGLAGKNEMHSALSAAFVMTRQAVGHCAVLGTCRTGFVCNDQSHLGTMPSSYTAPNVQAPVSQQQAMGNGVMVAQHPNQPGQGQPGMSQPGVGGLVSQSPTQPIPTAGGQTLNYQGGTRGVMVDQFPTPPQL